MSKTWFQVENLVTPYITTVQTWLAKYLNGDHCKGQKWFELETVLTLWFDKCQKLGPKLKT